MSDTTVPYLVSLIPRLPAAQPFDPTTGTMPVSVATPTWPTAQPPTGGVVVVVAAAATRQQQDAAPAAVAAQPPLRPTLVVLPLRLLPKTPNSHSVTTMLQTM